MSLVVNAGRRSNTGLTNGVPISTERKALPDAVCALLTHKSWQERNPRRLLIARVLPLLMDLNRYFALPARINLKPLYPIFSRREAEQNSGADRHAARACSISRSAELGTRHKEFPPHFAPLVRKGLRVTGTALPPCGAFFMLIFARNPQARAHRSLPFATDCAKMRARILPGLAQNDANPYSSIGRTAEMLLRMKLNCRDRR